MAGRAAGDTKPRAASSCLGVGSRVKKGQVLAVLDKQPYVLAVQAAEAALSKSKAERL